MSWNAEGGDGVIKEFRSDGTEFLVSLSRYRNTSGVPNGLFIGGDLPLGDPERTQDSSNNNTGMAYYNGKRWLHIWCSLNEGVSIAGAGKQVYAPENWMYLGGRVHKATASQVILESEHEITLTLLNGMPVTLGMDRKMFKKLDQDYLILEVSFVNKSPVPLTYTYELGDEPWVGDFYRGSKGNVGWTDGMTYEYEGFIRTDSHRFAGYWDIGNSNINEQGEFTGVADFVEWLSEPPSYAYFANNFGYRRVDRKKPLSSRDNRVIGLVWLDQPLKPGERRTHVLALGMAMPHPERGVYFPIKPHVVFSGE